MAILDECQRIVEEAVSRIRSFNRLVTERVGALDDRYLAGGGRSERRASSGRSATTAQRYGASASVSVSIRAT